MGVGPFAVLIPLLSAALLAQQPAPPKILFESSPRAVEYQLGRLSNAELVLVERKPDDRKYRPVYIALLTRSGIGREYLDEALAALATMDGTPAPRVLLEAAGRIEPDAPDADRLIRLLLAQPAPLLRQERAAIAGAIEGAAPPVLRATYGALMIADGNPQAAWDAASKQEGHLLELLRSVPLMNGAAEVRASLFDRIAGLLKETEEAPLRAAAIAALGATRADSGTFRLLAGELVKTTDDTIRAAAVRSLQRLPREAWPEADVEPLVRAIVGSVEKMPAGQRTEAASVEAIQLAEKLAGALPEAARRAVLRDLRALGVQVVRVESVPEQMMFDLRWFAVEAGKPVQIVFYNPDAMAHNLLVVRPGSLKEVGTAASLMAPPSDPKAKAFVPDTPLVLQATRLLNWAETERLSFTAPKEAGEYPFVCTFPGHWVRMYGVMLVVENLEAWEASRTPPKDPMTGQPYPSER